MSAPVLKFGIGDKVWAILWKYDDRPDVVCPDCEGAKELTNDSQRRVKCLRCLGFGEVGGGAVGRNEPVRATISQIYIDEDGATYDLIPHTLGLCNEEEQNLFRTKTEALARCKELAAEEAR